MKMKTKRRRPIERSHFGQMADLNSLNWNDDQSNTPGDDPWLRAFEKSEVSQAEAEAMFRRVEASYNRKFQI